MPYRGEWERFANFTMFLNHLETALDMTFEWERFPEALLGVEWATIRNEATDKWELFEIPKREDHDND
jgi:hypothetical protein